MTTFCGLALTAGLALAPSTARAASVTIDDTTGDTWVSHYDPEAGQTVWQESDVDQNVDVTRTVVKHTAKRISVTATYADLSDDSTYVPTYWAFFRLPDGRMAAASAFVDENFDPLTYVTIQRTPGGSWNKHLPCEGVKTQWHWDQDRLTMSFPRSCYGSPAWFRFHGDSAGGWVDPTPEQIGVWLGDNAHSPDQATSLTELDQLSPFTKRLRAG